MTTQAEDSGAERHSLLAGLPDELQVTRVLARRADEAVALATENGATVAVRCLARPRGSALAEWAALRAIESPFVARIASFGTLEGGGLWVTREWIDGESLESFARGASEAQLAGVAADVLRALQDVHATGIVHGDISPGNIIVDGEGRGRLTDFGLAASVDDDTRGRRSGTPMFMAPEVLAGGSASPQADLFGVGVVLALSLSAVQIEPSEFYGRFPAEPFLEAAGIDVATLPDWSRLLLARLLSRDPAARGESPRALADQLEASIGNVEIDTRTPVGPRFGVLDGRDAFEAEVAALGPGLAWTTAADDQECGDLVEALAIARMRAGDRLALVDLDRMARRSTDTLDLDRRIAAVLRTSPSEGDCRRLLIVRVNAVDDWALATLDALGHAALAAGGWAAVAVLDPLGSPGMGRPDSPWRGGKELALTALPSAAIQATLGSAFENSGPTDEKRVAALADRIDLLARGSVSAANELVRRAEQLGAFEWARDASGGGLRLSETFSPDSLTPPGAGRLPDRTGQDVRELLAAIGVLGGVAAQHQLAEMVGATALRRGLDEAVESGLVSLIPGGRIRSRVSNIQLSALGVPRDRMRALHAAALAGTAAETGGIAAPESWVHLLGSAPGSGPDDSHVATVATACRHLERRGLRARIARGLLSARSVLESELRALPPSMMEQLALALARSGQARRAREVAALTPGPTIAAEVDGILAHIAGDREVAADAFERAGRPLQARLERAHAAFERADLAAFDRVLAETEDPDTDHDRGSAVARVDLIALAALVAQRRGEHGDAWAKLDEALALAQENDAPISEGAVRVNRGILARAQGDSDRALGELEAARALYHTIGYAIGEAQVQALFGSTLKERGDLLAAEEPLRTALVRRQRLGQRVAAATARGMLGLLMLERGHLRQAVDELRLAGSTLRGVAQADNAVLIDAALDLALARLGAPPASGCESAPSTNESVSSMRDPRIAIWHARAAWVRGELTSAEAWLGPEADDSRDARVEALRSALGTPLTPTENDESLIVDEGTRAEELLEHAAALRKRGRDDRAARFAIEAAVRARSAGEQEPHGRARRLARTALDAAHVGLTDEEAAAATRALLGRPDPRPQSLLSWSEHEDDEMDVMTILELNERLVRQEDTHTLLGAIVEAALEVTGAERGFLVLSRDGEFELDTAFDSSRGEIEDADVEYSRSIIEQVLATKSSLRVSDALEHAEWGAARSVEELHLRSILAAPFFVTPRLAGVMVVDDRTRPGAFGPREQRLLELLGGQAALAIRQVQRLEENRSLAAELRRRVEAQGVQLAAAQRAMDKASVVAPIEGLIGESEAMQDVRAMIHRVALANIPTLITGPSGSGKEVAARAIHALSPRKDAPFVSENCAALPPSLVEAELFGAQKGSYTGADVDRIGLFERADGGTLFLDEIGELPLEAQAKLLRVLETRRIRRLGEEIERPVDFRLVSATNRDLAAEVERDAFRSDLMYRLDGVTIRMPPISERVDDLPALVRHLLMVHASDPGAPKVMAPEVLQRLVERPWPGNVRELANEVRRLCVLSDAEIVDPSLVRDAAVPSGAPQREGKAAGAPLRTIAELERAAIFDALEATNGDKRRAAEILGISRAKIYQRLKEWGEDPASPRA